MLKWHFRVFGFAKKFPRKTMWLLDFFGSGLVNLKSQNLKPPMPCSCFSRVFSRIRGFPVTMLRTLLGRFHFFDKVKNPIHLLYCKSCASICTPKWIYVKPGFYFERSGSFHSRNVILSHVPFRQSNLEIGTIEMEKQYVLID